jgi:signal transduction histidine kinase
MWLGTDLPGTPHGKAAVIRILAAALILVGCFGAALGEVREQQALKRGLYWYLAAQFASLGLIQTQLSVVWARSDLARGVEAMVGLSYLFLWLMLTADGQLNVRPWKPLTLFGGNAEQELRSKYEEQIRAAAAQEERHRLARELHDSIKQQIFAVQTAAATAEARYGADDEGTREALRQVRGAAREAMAEMEAMLDQLRATPLENAGLIAAVKQQCEALGIRTGAEVEFTPGPMPVNEAMPPGSQQAIFRVAQEALANVARHARARKVEVRLERIGHEVRLRVADNGAGFDTNAAPRGMGLGNMSARAEELGGVLELTSSEGRGTAVELRVPCGPERENEAEEHLKMALVWGALALFLVWESMRTWSALGLGLLLVAAAGCMRSLRGWRRQKREEAR